MWRKSNLTVLVRSCPLLFLLLVSQDCLAWTVTGDVVDVYDGDTIYIEDAVNGYLHLVKLSAIDAPELAQQHGKISRQYLYDMVVGKKATADCYRTIRARVEICSVIVNGKDIGLVQLETGMAWRKRRYVEGQHVKKRYAYEKAEAKAIEEKAGIWSQNNPLPPWKWRERNERWDWYWDWYWHKDT